MRPYYKLTLQEQTLAALLYIGVTTSDQLSEYFDFISVHSACNILAQLRNAGWVEVHHRKKTINACYVYYITRKGIEHICRVLEKECWETNGQELLPVYTAPKKFATTYLPHAIAVRSWFLRSAKIFGYDGFDWWPEEKRKITSLDGVSILDIDAVIQVGDKKIYIEQDLNTEHRQQIYDKFNKYNTLWLEGLIKGSVLLSVFCEDIRSVDIDREDMNDGKEMLKQARQKYEESKLLLQYKNNGVEEVRSEYNKLSIALDYFKDQLSPAKVKEKEKEKLLMESFLADPNQEFETLYNSLRDNVQETLRSLKETKKKALDAHKTQIETRRVDDLKKWLTAEIGANQLYRALASGMDVYINSDYGTSTYIRNEVAGNISVLDKVYQFLNESFRIRYQEDTTARFTRHRETIVKYETYSGYLSRALEIRVSGELELFIAVESMAYNNIGGYVRSREFVKQFQHTGDEAASLILIVDSFSTAYSFAKEIGDTSFRIIFVEEARLRGEEQEYRTRLLQSQNLFFIIEKDMQVPTFISI